MELRQLKYLVTVIEEASFTHAASRLHVTQPGVSAQIKELEREVGERLLDRQGRTVRPTAAGEALLPYARAALEAVEGARAVVGELTGLIRGQARFGTVTSMTPVDLSDLFAAFHACHPGVALSLTEAPADHLLQGLRAGRLDAVIVGSVPLPSDTGTQVIADEALVAAVPPGDPLAERAEITPDALRTRPLICLPRGTGLRTCADEVCTAAGFRPNVAFETGDPDMAARFARHGLGVALLAEATARRHEPHVRTLTFAHAPRARLLLAWRGEGPTSPAARALIRHARAALPDL
ncbi:LysR family transcriptional regulator [Streptomyces sp. NPDC041068]|uniref:LysR family transcriptional regulator n=1 Tax=Streptomyces sp. NPDC041068 TaxID=3155130 RepID=UPI0033F54A99